MVVYNLPVQLTAQERASYDYWREVYNSTLARFGADAALASSCIASKDNRLAYALSMGWHEGLGKRDRWSPQVLGKAANMWLKASKQCEGIVAFSWNKYALTRSLVSNGMAGLIYSNESQFCDYVAGTSIHAAMPYHGKLASQQREITTTKKFKTKPDEVTTRTKLVGPASLRREAVEAFVDPASPVRVLCVSRLPDYDSRLRNCPLLINTSGNVELTELLQPQVCVYLVCQNTFEVNKLLRKQRGQQVQEISSIHQISIPHVSN